MMYKRIVFSVCVSNTDDNSLSFDLLLEVAPYFRLPLEEAKIIMKDIKTVVSDWRTVATKYKITRAEQDMMARAFRY